MDRQFSFHQSSVFRIHSDLSFFHRLGKQEMLGLNLLIDRIRTCAYCSGLELLTVDILKRLEARTTAAGAESYKHLPLTHSLTVVRQSTVILKSFIELCDIPHISEVVAEGRPMQVGLDCSDRGGSSITAERLLQDLGLFCLRQPAETAGPPPSALPKPYSNWQLMSEGLKLETMGQFHSTTGLWSPTNARGVGSCIVISAQQESMSKKLCRRSVGDVVAFTPKLLLSVLCVHWSLAPWMSGMIRLHSILLDHGGMSTNSLLAK